MRRKTKRAFRYFFPVTLFLTCLLLFNDKSSRDVNIGMQPQEKPQSSKYINTGAKTLNLSSHNPQSQEKLKIEAVDAIQKIDGELTLRSPSGLFESSRGPNSLTSVEALYREIDREVEFLQSVNFTHHSGLTAITERAVVNTQTQVISGEQGIKACHKSSTITANSYEIQNSGDLINFSGRVCLNISQKH
ncbi:MAG: LPS export ABC transporter periplasmic protein LptC [Alphaproteobacteria bacterium]